MMLRAVHNGVSPERIAAALNLSVRDVEKSITLLDGVHAEAADLLKDKAIAPKAIRWLKKVRPLRQIEISELIGHREQLYRQLHGSFGFSNFEGPVDES